MDTFALTIKDLAHELKVSTKTCYKLIKKNAVPFVRIGRSYRIPRSYLLELLNSNDKIDLHAGC